MKALVILLIVLTSAAPAFAHRLDEYLQASTVSLEKDHVSIRLRLTPGVDIFKKLIDDIDTDHDGTISNPEQNAYAQRVRSDLSLTVDGTQSELALVSSTFATVELMRQGVGEIELYFTAVIPPGGQTRKLVFKNHHRADISVYLVNCLVPADPALAVTGQDRSYNQSVYRLDYSQADATSSKRAEDRGWLRRWGGATLFRSYFYQGVHHILTGYDHLLFVSALVLAATTLWELVKVVTAFTIAHTITLTLATLGVVHLSGWIVEPLISASIMFVAIQNVFWPGRSRGWSRFGAAFFFGLFHGLGFAGGLADAMHEMQGGTMFLAITAFSLGVEAGHQMVVLPLFAALKAARSTRPDTVARTRLSMAVQRIGSAGISVAGGYYLVLALAGHF